MVDLVDLPDEIIELIVKSGLHIRDMVALLCTCKRFNIVSDITPYNPTSVLSVDDESIVNKYYYDDHIPPAWKTSIVYIDDMHNSLHLSYYKLPNRITYHHSASILMVSTSSVQSYSAVNCNVYVTYHTMAVLICDSCKLVDCSIMRLVCGGDSQSFINNCQITSLSVRGSNYIFYGCTLSCLKHLECNYDLYKVIAPSLSDLQSLTLESSSGYIHDNSITHKVRSFSIIYNGGILRLPSYNCDEITIVVSKPSRINVWDSVPKLCVNGHTLAAIDLIDRDELVELSIYNIYSASITGLSLEKLTIIRSNLLIRSGSIILHNLKWLRTDMALPTIGLLEAPQLSYLSMVSGDYPNEVLPKIASLFPKLKTLVIWLGEYLCEVDAWTNPMCHIVDAYDDIRSEEYSFNIYTYQIEESIDKPLNYPMHKRYRVNIDDDYAKELGI